MTKIRDKKIELMVGFDTHDMIGLSVGVTHTEEACRVYGPENAKAKHTIALTTDTAHMLGSMLIDLADKVEKVNASYSTTVATIANYKQTMEEGPLCQ